MNRAIITYATGAHEELLEVSLPTYKEFAHRHGYDLVVGTKLTNLPPAWNKVQLLLDALDEYSEVVWFDCDLVVVYLGIDFPEMDDSLHSLVRHFESYSEVPNSGVWRLRKEVGEARSEYLLRMMLQLEVFTNHGWWEQAALMTLMGYCVPPEGSDFLETKCRCVHPTAWYQLCQFMRLKYNSHPNYRAERPVIVHCSYPSIPQRLDVMRKLVKDPTFDYPPYDKLEDNDESEAG